MPTKYNIKITRPNKNVDWPTSARINDSTLNWFSSQPNMTYEKTVTDFDKVHTFTFPTRDDYNTFRANYQTALAQGVIAGDQADWITEVQENNIVRSSWVVDV